MGSLSKIGETEKPFKSGIINKVKTTKCQPPNAIKMQKLNDVLDRRMT